MAKSKSFPRTAPATKNAATKSAARKTAAKIKPAAKPATARRSPGKLKLTLMTGNYEIVRALKDGTVQPKGIELIMGGYPGGRDIHTKVAVGEGCDINEFNGVPHRSITYVVERREDVTSMDMPAEIKIELLPKGKDVEEMLLNAELDVIMAPGVPRAVAERDPRVGHLWDDYVEVERDYFRRTGIFPIMHITTVPMEIVAKHPWVVGSLTHAFEEAKQLAFKRLANPRIVPLAWFRSAWEDERHFLGRDPWEYGLSEINKKNYDLLAQFVFEQGMTRRRMNLRDLFAKEAFELELPLALKHPVEFDF